MMIFENFNLTNHNSYRLNSTCKKAYFPETENDIVKLFQESNVPKIILGNGNNVLLTKEFYNEDFIIFNGCFDKIVVNGNEIIAEAGATMIQLSEIALKYSLSGFEVFYDIPSSVGGAVVMNAGTKDGEIKDILLKIRYLDLTDMNIREISCDEIGFEYRNSFFQKNTDKIVLKAWFHLIPGSPSLIRNRMDEIKKIRWEKQPRGYPNCGSVFKRPSGRFVGPMIDELGLKGFSIGGARISEKHGGFIINIGNATGQDILELINHIQKMVKHRFGLELEIEQRVI